MHESRMDWFDDIARDARRYSVVFLHLGHVFESYRSELNNVGGKCLLVADYLNEENASAEDHLVILTDVEHCLTSNDASLNDLRVRILRDIDERGMKFVLVSRLARAAFPDGPGSDLLADAKHVFGALLSDPGVEAFPSWSSDHDIHDFLACCVSELSAETVTHLSEFIWEVGLSPNECLEALDSTDRESLRGAGLIALAADTSMWVVPSHWKAFRAAVAEASAKFMHTPAWLGAIFVDLWLIERQIRNAIRGALIARAGIGWRASCASGDLVQELVERAQKDVQPRAMSLKDLRDPLEWLTTSELLDLREHRGLGELGMESFMWTRLRSDLLPIRNRAAHMRLVSERDARTASTWRKIVMTKL